MNQLNNQPITLILIFKNEATNLQSNFTWLDKCERINEIVAIDDNSTDNSVKILKSYQNKGRKVSVFTQPLNNNFSSQRNFAISKSTNDWILWLDSDEQPDDKLIEFINHIDTSKHIDHSFKRIDYFIGNRLNHGETAHNNFIRIFNKSKGKFIYPVHEVWKSSNPNVAHTDIFIHHQSINNLSQFFNKINLYSSIRADQLFTHHQSFNPIDIITYPLGKFLLNYIIRLGFLDSTAGIVIALGMSFHSFLVRAKLWHLYQH